MISWKIQKSDLKIRHFRLWRARVKIISNVKFREFLRPIVQVEFAENSDLPVELALVISKSKNVRLFNLDADSRACTLALSITRQLPAALRLSAGLRWRSRVVLDAADRRARLKYFP